MYTTQELPTAYYSTLAHLDRLAEQWRRTGECPPETGTLSSGEYRALAMVAGRETELRTPILDFLSLDGLLQRWILETWGRPSLVGMRVG
ncbi:hypothetical protein ACQ858_14900 [Variovorax ureilyticus]|uniref:hypothetical protein n=1 Tax=Variovorax ureilyticus TaxID=1836198 RepID=UPI003D6751CB